MGRKKSTKKEKKEKKERRQDKVGVIHSLKFRMTVLMICAVIVTCSVILALIIPAAQRTLLDQTMNYLQDVTVSDGSKLDVLRMQTQNNNADFLRSAFKDVGIEGVASSYAYVVDSTGTMKYHPTEEKIGKPVENAAIKGVVQQMAQKQRPESKVVTYDFNGVKKYASYYVDETCDTVLVISADESDILAPLHRVVYISIGAAVIVVIVMTILSLIMISTNLRPIGRISDIVSKMAGMDFTPTPGAEKLVKRKDETGVMSRSVANLRKELVTMVEEIQSKSNDLFSASERLDRDASDTAKTVEQVGNAVGDIASGATNQAQETQNATEHVIDMGNMIEATNKEAEILENNSQSMKNSSDHAMAILNELMAVNERTKVSIEEIYEQTNITNASAQKIKDATSLIASIAEETNLLSLNASIEAARAGEQGRGFAVVASQIQKLAEQSNESASQIDDITSALIKDSTRAVETMQQVRNIMDEQSDKMTQTDQMFHQVNNGVANALESVVNITGKTENLDDSREKVVDVVQNLSAIAEENAASSEETSASVAEVTNIVQDISENAALLKEIAYGLDQSVKKIRL